MISLMLIDTMDVFCSLFTDQVVVALDNVPIYVSNAVKEHREYLEKRGLTLYFLTRYSPALNLIEIILRKI